jgi:hypothetical protein
MARFNTQDREYDFQKIISTICGRQPSAQAIEAYVAELKDGSFNDRPEAVRAGILGVVLDTTRSTICIRLDECFRGPFSTAVTPVPIFNHLGICMNLGAECLSEDVPEELSWITNFGPKGRYGEPSCCPK